MFTCSSCGYEANPDSALACSLCGTKKPGAGGAPAKAAPSKPAPPTDDELASAAKAVAEQATAEVAKPAPAKASAAKGAKAAPRTSGAVAMETSTGVLRLKHEPAPIDNASTVLGAFVGMVLGYVISWHQAGHAPASWTEILMPLGGTIVLGFVGRFAITSFLEDKLTMDARETFAGAGAALVGVLLAIFMLFAFWAGGSSNKAAAVEQTQASAVGADGRVFAQHVALLLPWNVQLKSDKETVLVNGPLKVRIPCGKLTKSDVEELQKGLQLSAADFEKYAADEPFAIGHRLPPGFSMEAFLDQVGSVYGVQKDSTPRGTGQPPVGRIFLARRRSAGGDEKLELADKPTVAGDLQTALPKGMKLWIGVALGLPQRAGAGPNHDQFVTAAYDEYGPKD